MLSSACKFARFGQRILRGLYNLCLLLFLLILLDIAASFFVRFDLEAEFVPFNPDVQGSCAYYRLCNKYGALGLIIAGRGELIPGRPRAPIRWNASLQYLQRQDIHRPETLDMFWPDTPAQLTNAYGFRSIKVMNRAIPPTVEWRVLVMPLWPALLLLAFPASVPLRSMYVRRRRMSRGLCLKCGYDLRESPERCPECGEIPKRKSKSHAYHGLSATNSL